MNTQIIQKNIKVRKIGDSYYILLDKDTRELLKIQNETPLKMKLWRIDEIDIMCPKCKTIFTDYVNLEPHDCPYCGKEIFDSELEHLPENPAGTGYDSDTADTNNLDYISEENLSLFRDPLEKIQAKGGAENDK